MYDEVVYNNKIDKIKNYFKKDELYLELSLLNYEIYNIYIRIDYIKKYKKYRISWFDLDIFDGKDVEKYIGYNYIEKNIIEGIEKDFLNVEDSLQYKNIEDIKNNRVKLVANIKTKVENNIDLEFNRCLPIRFNFIQDFIIFIFDNIPRKFDYFLHEILKDVISNNTYTYKREIVFDIYNDDINKLFDDTIIDRGIKYYEENKILFIEKIMGKYVAVVSGTQKYVVIIEYNEENKVLKLYCTCPCEFYCKHMYAVLLAIKNNIIKKYYKISYKDPNKDLIDNVVNFNFLLCTGISDGAFEVITNNGELIYISIKDSDGSYNFKVVEDDEDNTLVNKIEKYLSRN